MNDKPVKADDVCVPVVVIDDVVGPDVPRIVIDVVGPDVPIIVNEVKGTEVPLNLSCDCECLLPIQSNICELNSDKEDTFNYLNDCTKVKVPHGSTITRADTISVTPHYDMCTMDITLGSNMDMTMCLRPIVNNTDVISNKIDNLMDASGQSQGKELGEIILKQLSDEKVIADDDTYQPIRDDYKKIRKKEGHDVRKIDQLDNESIDVKRTKTVRFDDESHVVDHESEVMPSQILSYEHFDELDCQTPNHIKISIGDKVTGWALVDSGASIGLVTSNWLNALYPKGYEHLLREPVVKVVSAVNGNHVKMLGVI